MGCMNSTLNNAIRKTQSKERREREERTHKNQHTSILKKKKNSILYQSTPSLLEYHKNKYVRTFSCTSSIRTPSLNKLKT